MERQQAEPARGRMQPSTGCDDLTPPSRSNSDSSSCSVTTDDALRRFYTESANLESKLDKSRHLISLIDQATELRKMRDQFVSSLLCEVADRKLAALQRQIDRLTSERSAA